MKRLLISSKGLTLIELLMSLVLVGMVTIIIMNYILSGMNSYERTSDQVSMHNDANYVMSLFVNEIYQAETITQIDFNNIRIESESDGEKIELGFKNEQAYIKHDGNDPVILSSFRFPHGEGESYLTVNENGTVEIKIVIENEDNGSKQELLNLISYGQPKQTGNRGTE